MVELHVGSSHIEVDLQQERFAHIDIWGFVHLLPIMQTDITVVVNYEELSVFLP